MLDQIGVETLAERLGIGSRHLSRLFMRHIGASPVETAQTLRTARARRLIDQTDLTMAEIAARFVPDLQRADPNFRAIRVDTCLDLIGEYDADFGTLLHSSERFAAGCGLDAPHIMGTPEAGRTFYLYGKGGGTLRVYEKGLEQRGKGNESAPLDWLRVEFQYAGIDAAKKLSIARLTPAELVRHKDFSRKWLEMAGAELGLVERGGEGCALRCRLSAQDQNA